MGCIYLLYDDDGNGYIGKTKRLKRRLREHKQKQNSSRSRFLNNFECLVIEEFDDEEDLDDAEQFYYDLYKDLYGDKIVNGCRPLQQKKEYRETHKERIKEKQKEYRETHKERIAEEQKEYREKNKERLAEGQKEYRERHKEQREEWREKNKEQIKEKDKQKYKKNKERILEQMKQKITCECGSVINYGDKARHFKTQKHKNNLSNNN